jgi:glycosyltransferase involved in cell wall biosynthesis
MKLNVLFGCYPWAFDCPGGGERQLMAWRSHLASLDVNVGLYDPWQPISPSWQIYHFFSVMPGSYQLCQYIKKKGLKLIVSPNLWVTPDTKWSYPHDEIQRLVSLADLLVVNSRMEAEVLGGVYHLPPEKFHVVYNGVEEIFFSKVKPNVFTEAYGLCGKRYLLNVANIEPRKNQLALLRALKDYPDVLLVVVGNARDSSYLEECRAEGGEKLCFVGPLDYGSEMLRSALAGAAGFVMPSKLETPSIAALEAAAAGCPVLITRIGSTTEYFEDCAVYVDPADLASICLGLGKLLDRKGPLDVSQRIRKLFTWRASTSELHYAYQRLLVGGNW